MDIFKWVGSETNRLSVHKKVTVSRWSRYGYSYPHDRKWETCFGPLLENEVNAIDIKVKICEEQSEHLKTDKGILFGIGICEVFEGEYDHSIPMNPIHKNFKFLLNSGVLIEKKTEQEVQNNAEKGLQIIYYDSEIREGDVVRVIFHPKTSKLSFEINGKRCGIAFDEFQVDKEDEKLKDPNVSYRLVVITRAKNFVCFGFFVDQKDFEEKERFQYVLCEIPNSLDIHLENKTLHLWKCFFIHSSIYENDKDKFSDDVLFSAYSLQNHSLEVDEELILQIILGKVFDDEIGRANFSTTLKEHVQDYFMFFKLLNMKTEMQFVLNQCFQNTENNDQSDSEGGTQLSSFIKLYRILENFSIFEIDEIKSLFVGGEKREKSSKIVFEKEKPEHSLTIFLLRQMFVLKEKLKYNTFETLSVDEKEIENIKAFRKMLMSNCKLEDFNPLNHKDMQTIPPNKSVMIRLWETRETTWNINLKLRETESEFHHFKAHKEILALHSNFFFRMMNFGGVESETMKSEGSIELFDMKKEVVEVLLELIYTGDIQTQKKENEEDESVVTVETILRLFLFGEKFMELKLMSESLRILNRMGPNAPSDQIWGLVKNPEIVEILKQNEKVRNFVVDTFGKWMIGFFQ